MANPDLFSIKKANSAAFIVWALTNLVYIVLIISFWNHPLLWLVEGISFLIVFLLRYATKDRLLNYIWRNKKTFVLRQGISAIVCIILSLLLWDWLDQCYHYPIIYTIEIYFLYWFNELIQARVEINKELREQ